MLDERVTQADEAELLTNFMRDQQRVRVVAPAGLFAAIAGGAVAGVYLAFGASLGWSFAPVLYATLAAMIAAALVLGIRGSDNDGDSAVASDHVMAPHSRWHPTVALATACAAAALSAVVPLLLLTSPSSLDTSAIHGEDAALVRGAPLLLWIGPTLLALLVVLTEIALHVTEKRAALRRVSSNRELQARAVRYRRGNLRTLIVFFEASQLTILATFSSSNLPLHLRDLSASDAFSFASLVLAGIGLFVGIVALMQSGLLAQHEHPAV